MSIFQELNRRNVVRTAVAYTIIGWLLIQVMEMAAESFEAPVWVMKMLITIVMLGFLPVLLFSWAYEITPEGIKHERDRALELLAEIIGVPGGLTRWEMYLDPRWDFFRDDERFNDLIRPHNLDR